MTLEPPAVKASGHWCHAATVLSLAVLTACASAPRQTPIAQPEPQACTDSTYVQLKRQHPDSLSERAYQRLESLDRECAQARAAAQATRDTNHMGQGHGGMLWMGVGGAALMMVAMLVAWGH